MAAKRMQLKPVSERVEQGKALSGRRTKERLEIKGKLKGPEADFLIYATENFEKLSKEFDDLRSEFNALAEKYNAALEMLEQNKIDTSFIGG